MSTLELGIILAFILALVAVAVFGYTTIRRQKAEAQAHRRKFHEAAGRLTEEQVGRFIDSMLAPSPIFTIGYGLVRRNDPHAGRDVPAIAIPEGRKAEAEAVLGFELPLNPDRDPWVYLLYPTEEDRTRVVALLDAAGWKVGLRDIRLTPEYRDRLRNGRWGDYSMAQNVVDVRDASEPGDEAKGILRVDIEVKNPSPAVRAAFREAQEDITYPTPDPAELAARRIAEGIVAVNEARAREAIGSGAASYLEVRPDGTESVATIIRDDDGTLLGVSMATWSSRPRTEPLSPEEARKVADQFKWAKRTFPEAFADQEAALNGGTR